jgi:thymidylate synthase (FAD)
MVERVTLVWATPSAEELVVRMARVSNPENQNNKETGPRLLRYLIKHKHWSPFEMCSLCVEIKTERDIAAQILRHRSFSFQEFSTRYSKTEQAEIPKWRTQDSKNRQASHDDLDLAVAKHFDQQTSALLQDIYLTYQNMLDTGIAKECARRILPLCTPTTLFMSGTLRSWIHYINVRTDESTQLEHRDIALACKAVFCSQFPVIAEALSW